MSVIPIHDDYEFEKHFLRKQFYILPLFFKQDSKIKMILQNLLEIPGNDPIKHSSLITLRWSVQCYLNLFEIPLTNPPPPIDFSSIHPLLSNLDLLQNASSSEVIDLYENFRFEFFNAIRLFNTQLASAFIILHSNQIPLYLTGRIISCYQLSSNSFDFTTIFHSRCQNFSHLTDLFEGFLCNIETKQVVAAQFAAPFFDQLMNDNALHLINTSIRRTTFYIDENIAFSSSLFPEVNIIPLILHASMVSIKGISKHLESLKNPISKRFQNQISLMERCQIDDNWEALHEHSVPYLLQDGCIDLFLPRDSQFISLSSQSWETDYDFLDDYLTFVSILKDRTIRPISSRISMDIFSLLFLNIFDFSFAHSLLQKLPHNKFVQHALEKADLLLSIKENPSFSDMFLPESEIDRIAIESGIKGIEKLLELRQTHVLCSSYYRVKNFPHFVPDVPKSLFSNRFNSIIPSIPEGYDSISLLDMAASSAQYGLFAEKVDGFDAFRAMILSKQRQLPIYVDLSPNTTILDFQKKLGTIMSSGLKSTSHLIIFSNYLIQFTLRYASQLSACSLATDLFEIEPNMFISDVLDQSTAIHEAEEELSSLDLVNFIFSQQTLQLNDKKLQELFIREPLPTIAFGSPDAIRRLVQGNQKYQKIDLFYQTKTLKEADLKTIEKMGDNEKMEALDDLIYQKDLSDSYVEILGLIQHLPIEWRINFLETYLAMLPLDSIGLIPVTQALASLKPLHSDDQTKSELKIGQSWDYLIKKLQNFNIFLNSPEKVFRLCKLHQRIHVIGTSIVVLAEKLAMLILVMKKFMTREAIEDFLKYNLDGSLSIGKLNDGRLSRMVSAISTLDYDCGKFLAQHIPVVIDPTDIRGLDLVSDDQKRIVILSYLENVVIDSEEAEFAILRYLVKIARFLHNNPIWILLNELTHFQLYAVSKESYSCADLPKLRNLATRFDISSVYPLFDFLQIPHDENYPKLLATFGLVQSSSIDAKRVFKSENLHFNLYNVLTDLSSLQAPLMPPLFSISERSNQLVVSIAKISSNKTLEITEPDFKCFMIENILLDYNSLNVDEFKLSDHPPSSLEESIMTSRIVEYLDSLEDAEPVLAFANDHSCVHFLLLFVKWAIDRNKEELFMLEGSRLKTIEMAKCFVKELQNALTLICQLTDLIDSQLLLSPSIIKTGNRIALRDLQLVLRHQIVIDPKHINLFDKKGNMAHVIGQLFVDSDFDRGFALARILKIDINEVMFEATAIIAQRSEDELISFLIAIIPRLSIDSSSQLIEALAPILRMQKGGSVLGRKLIAGIEDPRQALQMAKLFQDINLWGTIAIENGLKQEIIDTCKEAKRKKKENMIRASQRWINEHV